MKNRNVFMGRLLRLAAYIETLPAFRFDFASWVGRGWKNDQDLSCGTTACAIGHATTMPEFRDLGLRLFRSTLRKEFVYPALENHVLSNAGGAEWDAVVDAMSNIFGLNEEATTYLFAPPDEEGEDDTMYGPRLSRQATAEDVAKRIRHFVIEGSYFQ